MRDYQRSKVYSAEQRVRWLLDSVGEDRSVSAYGSTWYIPEDVRFARLEDVQRYVDSVLALDQVRYLWPSAGPIRVRARRGATKAHYCMGEIAIPPYEIGGKWALREIVVLHEIAHHLAPVGEQHGPSFCRTFVRLLTVTSHEAAARLLEISFSEEGVNILSPTC